MLVLWLGSREVISGRITLGEFVAFNSYLTMLTWPMIAFGWVTNMLQRGMASWKRMLEVLDTVPAIADADEDAEGAEDAERRGRAERSVRLQPRPRSAARSNSATSRSATTARRSWTTCPLASRPGRPSRSSASPDRASRRSSACWRGCTIRRRARCSSTASTSATSRSRSLRGAIGFVPQEPFLFSDTLADNVAFGLDARCGRRGG